MKVIYADNWKERIERCKEINKSKCRADQTARHFCACQNWIAFAAFLCYNADVYKPTIYLSFSIMARFAWIR